MPRLESVPVAQARGSSEEIESGPAFAIVEEDAFAGRLADRINEEHANPVTKAGEMTRHRTAEEAFESSAEYVIVPVRRPVPALLLEADRLAYATGTPWFPIIQDSLVIRVGPLVGPPAAPCFECAAQRQVQHDAQFTATHLFLEAYDANADLGPGGCLPHHLTMAAGLTVDLLRRHGVYSGAEATEQVSTVVELNLVTGSISANQVIACFDCDRCVRPGPSARTAVPESVLRVLRQRGRAPELAGNGS
jgi:bacteriocin biosynthesis cyclodehydratase domain-containing protein